MCYIESREDAKQGPPPCVVREVPEYNTLSIGISLTISKKSNFEVEEEDVDHSSFGLQNPSAKLALNTCVK